MKAVITFIFLVCTFFPTHLFALPADDVVPLIDRDYFSQVHSALQDAKESVFCVMYSARISPKYKQGQEHILINDLIDAHKRGVEVTVIFEKNIAFWESGNKGRKVERKSLEAYELLKEKGVPVYYDGIRCVTHSKILVIDNNITILGSTNWTYSALKKNHEASVLIKSKSVAEAFMEKLKQIKY